MNDKAIVYFSAEIDARKEPMIDAMATKLRHDVDTYNKLSGVKEPLEEDSSPGGFGDVDGTSPTAEAIRDGLKQLVDDAFDTWKDMADPTDWANAKANLENAVTPLIASSASGYSESDIGADSISGANAPIPKFADDTTASISGWYGETATTFKHNYVNRFGWVIGVQANLGKTLQLAAEAEHEAYSTAQRNLLDLMDDFTDAVNNLGSSGGDEKDFMIGVVMATAGVVGVMTLPTGALIGTLAAAGGASVLNDFMSKFGPKSEHSGDSVMEGGDVVELWSNLKKHLRSVRKELQETETVLHDALAEVWGALGGQVENRYFESVPAMDMLMPPAPGFVEKVQKAATGKNPDEEMEKLQDQVEGEVNDGADDGDQVEPPGGEYEPEPIDT